MVIAGRFTVEVEVASGGMGVVYRARDARTGATVALKLLAQRDADTQQRFEREAEILATLDHPAIVRYIAHGTTDAGVPFLAMDWVDGETLFERLSHTGFSIADTLELGRAVAAALGYAHAHGVIHRDVKPSNLILRDKHVARAAVLDFGIARAAAMSTSLTKTGAMLGTPSYMAPEQARGERTLDARVDVFSLGCVLYECATGRMAFEGRHPLALVAKVVLWDPPKPSSLAEGVPPELEALLARMLAKDPARRPRDGTEVAAALAQITVGETPQRRNPARHDAATVASTTPPRLVSLVAAAPLGGADGEAPRLETSVLEARRAVLATTLEPFAVTFELLGDGSLVVLVAGNESVSVVRRAIECAHAIRRAAPDLLVAVKSGTFDGNLLEATVSALAKEAIAAVFAGVSAPVRPKGAIRLDETTAKLCALDTIVRAGGVAYLASP